ncbi:MAG TPA: hypothetical protein VG963_07975, partial [Polyangiaceae bacterium]|nr:hypothetical protein [Polyangiaceae bacterium]
YAAVRSQHSKSENMPYSLADRDREIHRTNVAHSNEIREALTQIEAWERVYPLPAHLPWQLAV